MQRKRQQRPATMTVEEAASALGISRSLAYELAKADRLPAPVIRLGRRLVVSREGLERALAREAASRAGSGDEAA